MRSALHILLAKWSPSRLFVAGEKGVWLDPSDITSMFQDAAGTTKAAVNSPVGLILDKSGNGKHASQASDLLRPTLKVDSGGRYYLEFTDHALATDAIDFSGTSKIAIAAGLRKVGDTASGVFAELTAVLDTNTGAFVLAAPSGGGTNKFALTSKGTVAATALTTSASYNGPISAVVAGTADIGNDSVRLRVNGSDAQTTTTDQGTGAFANAAIYIGRRGGLTVPFVGRMYGLLIRGAATHDTDIARAERYMASLTGVNL